MMYTSISDKRVYQVYIPMNTLNNVYSMNVPDVSRVVSTVIQKVENENVASTRVILKMTIKQKGQSPI